jgi:ATP-dependent protease ClpP protease subunit
MRKLLTATMMAACLTTTAACAESFDSKNTIVLNRVISSKTMAPVSMKMAELMQPGRTPKVLNLVIDSPGGSVYAGFRFIAEMKAIQSKGTKIVCYVPGLAASMAFHILAQCNERIVLEESALLWHRARVFVMFGVITAPAADALAKDLQAIDDHILRAVSQSLHSDLPAEAIQYHFNHETLHIGKNLCDAAPSFCTARAAVPGLIEVLNSRVTTQEEEQENVLDLLSIESVVYIYSRYVETVLDKGEE